MTLTPHAWTLFTIAGPISCAIIWFVLEWWRTGESLNMVLNSAADCEPLNSSIDVDLTDAIIR